MRTVSLSPSDFLLGLLMEQGPLVFFTLWQIKMATVQSSRSSESSNSASAQLLRADAGIVLNSPRAPFFFFYSNGLNVEGGKNNPHHEK